VDTINVFVDDDPEKRRRKRNMTLMLVALVAAIVVLAHKPSEPVPVTVPIEPSRLPARPISVTPSILTPAPVPIAPTATVAPPPRPVRRVPRATPAPVTPPPRPLPAEPPTTSSAPVDTVTNPPAAPAPLLALDVTPRSLHFTAPGAQTVTVSNPNDAPIRIDRVKIVGARGDSVAGYQLDAKACNGVLLQPHASCRGSVFAFPMAIAARQSIHIEVYPDRRR
jgi:hypothetical protein